MDGTGVENPSTLHDDLTGGIFLTDKISRITVDEYRREVYAREFETPTNTNLFHLSTSFPWSTIMILGLGGIGAWTALWFSRLRTTQSMVLLEPDYIDISNLNRTPFGLDDVNDLKVRAVAQRISENNPLMNVFPFNVYFDESFSQEMCQCAEGPDWISVRGDEILVVDCRDNFFDDYGLFDDIEKRWRCKFTVIRAAYNGGSITIDFCPKEHPVMGRGGYDAQPSHVLPSAMSGMLVMLAAMNYYEYKEDKPYLFNNPITFDSTRMLEYIFNGMMMHRLACSGDTNALNVIRDLESNSFFASAEESAVLPALHEVSSDVDERTEEEVEVEEEILQTPVIRQIPIPARQPDIVPI